ncbi:MAG TPA: alpha/beta hydrolase, partial [Candidatus Binataceae bacterium]|nr:alpha/beta hydrolase [Candidatus Binataceae bacterium]
KLVLIDAVGLKVEGAPIADIFAPAPPEARRLFFYDPESELAMTMVPDVPSPELLEMVLRAREGTARVGWNPYLADPRLRERLYRISVPTLLIWGDTDRVVPIQHANAYKQGITQSRLAMINNCGHCPPFEKPEETASLIASFLKG